MKKHFFTLTLGFALTFIAQAQITINRSHLIVSGQVLTQATDTNKFRIQSGGINKTWNFSTLQSSSVDNIRFGNAEWYPGHQNFPNANLASINSSDDSSYSYLKLDNSELAFEGTYETINGDIQISKFKNTILTFPSTYATTFAGSVLVPFDQFYFGEDIDSTGPYPFIDSFRLKIEYNTTSNIEGWGKVITPLGTYDALLQNIRNISRVRVDMKTSGIWVGVPSAILNSLNLGSFESDTSYQHQFWTNDANVGFPLVSYSYSVGDTSVSEIDWLKTKPQQSGINATRSAFNALAYPNPFQNSITVSIPTNTFAKISVYDMNGKMVIEQAVNNNETIDMSFLSRGIYTCKIIDSVNHTLLQTQKLIKY